MKLALALLVALLYAVAASKLWRPARAAHAVWLVAVALSLHASTLVVELLHHGALTIGITEALSLFAWQSALLLWVLCWWEPLAVLGAVIYPLAAVTALLAAIWPSPLAAIPVADWKVQVHIVLSLLAAGLLTLAMAQSLALAAQDRMLHRHGHGHEGGVWLRALPPLQTMERLLFVMIGLGFFLLTLTLLSGVLFVHNLFAQHLAHKTVLSLVAWVIFGVLLLGRRFNGWRGRTAIRWTLSGYALLILAYFGSKLVLEEILHRHWT